MGSAQSDKELATLDLLNNNAQMQAKLHELFAVVDDDESGELTIAEVEKILMDPNSHAYLQSLGIDVTDAWTLLKLLDGDSTGTVDLEEFTQGCMSLRGGAKAIHLAMLAYDQRNLMDLMEEFMNRTCRQLNALVRADADTKRGGKGSSSP